ncbi:MAG: PorV/PorQ family protein [Candidatus Saganbacteria bacterium]|nr:PorV/PorQ family protein [Candidatus Saganbacteria bacterium]
MKKIFITGCALLLLIDLAWAGAGTAGGQFLLLGGGARAIAMGDAYVALAEGSSAVFWNPAGLSRTEFTQIGYMYNQWFVDVKHQYLDLAYPTDNGVFGGSYSILDSGNIQGYDSTGAPTSTIKATDTGLAIAWGRRVNERFAWGIGAKNITENLENSSAVATALDAGLLYEFNPNLTFGLAVQNVGTPLKFISENTPLPQTYRLGLASVNRLLENKLSLAIDYVSSAGSTASLNYGLEYLLSGLVALRYGSAAGRMRAGVGISSGNYGLDYAYVAHDDLGSAHQISFSYSFGTRDDRQAIKLEYLAMAKAYYDKARFSEAIVAAKNVLELDPNDADARALLTKAENALSGKAEGTVEKDIKAEKQEEAQVFIDNGNKFFAEKQYLEAIAEFNKALKVVPSHPEAVKMIRESQEALEKEVAEQVKQEAANHLGLARKYIAEENYTEAMKEVQEVLKIDPGNVQALQLYKKLQNIMELEKK